MAQPIKPTVIDDKRLDKVVEIDRKLVKLDSMDKNVADLKRSAATHDTEIKAVRNDVVSVKSAIDALGRRMEEQSKAITDKDRKIFELEKELAKSVAERKSILDRLEKQQAKRPDMKVDDLASHFKGVLGKINSTSPSKGESKVVIDEMEVELKGGLTLDKDVKLSQIGGHELTPDNVSSIRLTLRPATSIKVVEE